MSIPIEFNSGTPKSNGDFLTKVRGLESKKVVRVAISVEQFFDLYTYLESTYGKDAQHPLLFRGQANRFWKLKPTLERDYGLLPVDYYLERATACIHEITSVLGKKAFTDSVPSYQQLGIINAVWEVERSIPTLPCIEYFAYLRHHGFPTPLLDWSRSPFVALYFAMIDRPAREIEDQVHPAIIVLIRDSGRGFSEGKSLVNCVGPYITTHPRHYSQQTQFTYAVRRLRLKSNPNQCKWFFCNHHTAINERSEFRILKIVFPKGHQERWEALRFLQAMNINPYTLFGTEDSLIASAALREFDLRNPSDGEINGYEAIT